MIVPEPSGISCASCGRWIKAGQARHHDEHQHTATCLSCGPWREQHR